MDETFFEEPVLEAFKIYLKETFEEEYDSGNFRHLTYLGIFESGFEAGLGNKQDY